MGVLGNPGGDFRLIADPSHLDGELIRFLLHHYQIYHDHQARGVLLARPSAILQRRPGAAALLYNDTVALSDPAQVIYHFESQTLPNRRLLPVRAPDVKELESHWKLYYHTFKEAVCTWLYAHLVPQKTALVEAFTRHTTPAEKLAMQLAFPLVAYRLGKVYQLGPGRAEEVLGVIRKGFDRIDRRLEDGRQYLFGERFGVGDILFAVMAAPTVQPEQFDGPRPRGSQMPPKMQQIVKELRERPAGQLALRIYREHYSRNEH